MRHPAVARNPDRLGLFHGKVTLCTCPIQCFFSSSNSLYFSRNALSFAENNLFQWEFFFRVVKSEL